MRFDDCLAFVLKAEGGKSDDPTDRGGRTNKGIIQREYDAWCRSHGRQPQDVWNITDEEVAAIYKQNYWDACSCSRLPVPVDMVVFDSAVQHGARKAIQLLQRALCVADDGVIGRDTMSALDEEAGREHDLARDVIAARRDYYDAIVAAHPEQVKFINGWKNRVANLAHEVAVA